MNREGVDAEGTDTLGASPAVASSSKAGDRSQRAAEGNKACGRVVKFESAVHVLPCAATAQHTLPAQQNSTCTQHINHRTENNSTTQVALPPDALAQTTVHDKHPTDVRGTQAGVTPQQRLPCALL